MKCDLCRTHPATSQFKLLCDSCVEAMNRLMLLGRWELEHGRDGKRTKPQQEILAAYLRVIEGDLCRRRSE